MSLSSIARSKLSSSSNLHKWVLLKNSLIASSSLSESSSSSSTPPNSPTGAFMFPNYYSYSEDIEGAHTRSSEALWLDTLLESLAHDDEDQVDEPHIEEDDDEDDDILSPMSSSDDLSQPYPPPLAPLPLDLPFPFSNLDILDDSIEHLSDEDTLNSSSDSTSSTSPSSSASSLPPSTPPSSPLRSWTLPKFSSTTSSPDHSPHIFSPSLFCPTNHSDSYSDPLPFSYIESPFVFRP